jgi:GTP-binding protein Era
VKSGLVAVAGRPNVGKSTLVNALCGDKVAITSKVPNTTRRRLFGVANGPGYQLALVDLPGFQRPIDLLTRRLQATVDSSFEDVDAVLLVVDARQRIGAGDRFVARRLFALERPVVIVLNKIDRLKPSHVLSQMQAASRLGGFHALHPVSAKTRDGVGELRDDLVALLPEGPALFPRDQTTDLALEERIAEVIREKALHLTREEIPHAILVDVEEIVERAVRAVLYVETESQKGILVGKRGSMIREIGTRARPEVEALVGRQVFLELVVKVKPKWRRDPRMLERLGL